MNMILNYLFEANLGLIFFGAAYLLLFHRETQFNVKRAYLLGAMLASVVFPLIELPLQLPPISVSNFIPEVYMPEITIGTGSIQTVSNSSTFNFWNSATWTYGIIALLLLLRFLIQLGRLFYYLNRQTYYQDENFKIAESVTASSTFSFFHYIVIGNADQLDESEKTRIIQHEKTHANSLHSFDIVLSELFIIACWFNPLVYIIKKQLISIHEFQADQQTLESTDVNTYCTLLARVSLLSAGFSFANHFNHSLTLKRIAMINAKKINMSYWKYVAILPIFILAVLFYACSDPSLSIVKSTPSGLKLPQEVSQLLDVNVKYPDGTNKTWLQSLNEWAAKNPDAEVMIGNGEGQISEDKFGTMKDELSSKYKKEYKKAEAVVLWRFAIAKYGPATGQLTGFVYLFGMTDHKVDAANSYSPFMTPPSLSKTLTKDGGKVYEAVEQSPVYPGGVPALQVYLQNEIKYPTIAVTNRVEGKVFVQFIVDSEGNVTDPGIVKGIGYGCDEEALRVVSGFPKWQPGTQNGIPVNVRYIVPINFQLNQGKSVAIKADVPTELGNDFTLEVSTEKFGNKVKLTGIVKSSSGSPIPGMIIIMKGTTMGVASNSDGKFQMESNQPTGTLVFSHIGYNTKEISY